MRQKQGASSVTGLIQKSKEELYDKYDIASMQQHLTTYCVIYL